MGESPTLGTYQANGATQYGWLHLPIQKDAGLAVDARTTDGSPLYVPAVAGKPR